MTLINKIKVGFRHTTLQCIICILYCVFTTPDQVFFHPHLSPPYLLLPTPPPFPLPITILLSVSVRCFLCFIPSLFPPSPATHLPSDSCQSVLCIYESVCILLVYFFHQIPHMSETGLSLTGLFHLACIIFLKFLLLFNYSCMPFLPIPPPHPISMHYFLMYQLRSVKAQSSWVLRDAR